MATVTDIVLASELNVEFDIGVETANKISLKVDGTSVVKVAGVLGAPSPVWNNTTKLLTFPAVNGAAAVVVDLSQFTTDIYVTGAAFNGATQVLTLTDNDGVTPDVVVDLSTLLGVSVDANNLLNNGTDGKPLFLVADLYTVSTEQFSIFGTSIGYTIDE